jgi:hypothetical protein
LWGTLDRTLAELAECSRRLPAYDGHAASNRIESILDMADKQANLDIPPRQVRLRRNQAGPAGSLQLKAG